MSLKDALKKIGLVAASVGVSAIPGVGGIVATMVADELGLDPNTPEDKLAKAVENATPDQIIKLKTLEANNKQKFFELGLEQSKLELQDRQGARELRLGTFRLGHTDIRADIMLIAAFLAVITIASLLALGGVDGATAVGGFLITVGGMFARNIGSAFDFHFGSSKGSKDKDAIIAANGARHGD